MDDKNKAKQYPLTMGHTQLLVSQPQKNAPASNSKQNNSKKTSWQSMMKDGPSKPHQSLCS